MDTTLYTDKPISTAKHCDDNGFVPHPKIKTILFDCYYELRTLLESSNSRPAILENIERSLLCKTFYLGFDIFECPDCGNENRIFRCCHSRFCNSCGIKLQKLIAHRAQYNALDVPHRHIVFTIPASLRNYFRIDRSLLNLLFIAARNAVVATVNHNLYKKLLRKLKKPKYQSNTTYLYKNFHNQFQCGMISTLHTFGRDLKWNPHIHSLVAEAYYHPKKDKIVRINYFDYDKLKHTFQYELLRLLSERLSDDFKKVKNQIYKHHDNGFYVYAKPNQYSDIDDDSLSSDVLSRNVQACVSYCMRYAARPSISEKRILEYNRDSKIVHWFYERHEDNKRIDVIEPAIDFLKRLIIHIPDNYFNMVRHYGFYAPKNRERLDHLHQLLGKQRNKYVLSKQERKQKLQCALNRLKFRSHCLDTFNRDVLKCSCGQQLVYVETYCPFQGGNQKNDQHYRRVCIDEMYSLQKRRKRSQVDSGRTKRV